MLSAELEQSSVAVLLREDKKSDTTGKAAAKKSNSDPMKLDDARTDLDGWIRTSFVLLRIIRGSTSESPNEKEKKADDVDGSSRASPSKNLKLKSALDLSQIVSVDDLCDYESDGIKGCYTEGEAWWERVLEILKPWREWEDIVTIEESDRNKKMADEAMRQISMVSRVIRFTRFALVQEELGDLPSWTRTRHREVQRRLGVSQNKCQGGSPNVLGSYAAGRSLRTNAAGSRKRARNNDDDETGARRNDSVAEESPEPVEEIREVWSSSHRDWEKSQRHWYSCAFIDGIVVPSDSAELIMLGANEIRRDSVKTEKRNTGSSHALNGYALCTSLLL
ncbi:hypothetical protein BJ742DRAFT_774397 [Cladochytrium replicatum]|nr:hypothetical protein BJ742DRAFT_774397 [Cladochytrium replicatum]